MAFKCSGCGITYPNVREQTGTLGQPHFCPECFEPEPDEDKKDDDVVTKAMKDDDEQDFQHPRSRMLAT